MQLDRALFTPNGFFPYPGNPRLPPTYPPGLPLQFAAAGKVLGWSWGPFVVEVAGALAAVWLCYLVAREFDVSPSLAAAGAAALGACPVFIFSSIQPISDTLATTWTLASIYTAIRARRHVAWAAACGAVFAVAVLTRPTNAVLLPALVVILGADWRRLGLAALCGLPGALWLAYYNHALYGSALASGYGDWRAAFATSYALPTLLHFARWLALLLPAALLALTSGLVFSRNVFSRINVALALWFTAVVALYACYEVSGQVWWCLRFILPALPALILAGLLGLESLAQRIAPHRRILFLHGAALLLTGWAVIGSAYWTKKLGVLYIRGYEQVYADAASAARTLLPGNSLVVSFNTCGALYAYTDFAILRWEQIDAARFAKLAVLAHQAGRPICAVIFDSEVKEALHERCPGEWTRVGTVKNVGLWRLTAATAP
jgi:hypothetical protein